VDAAAESGKNHGLDAGQAARLLRQQSPCSRDEDGTKSPSIQMRHDIERYFLRSAQFELRDDMADGPHGLPMRSEAQRPAQ
jgi:hypothetical protein